MELSGTINLRSIFKLYYKKDNSVTVLLFIFIHKTMYFLTCRGTYCKWFFPTHPELTVLAVFCLSDVHIDWDSSGQNSSLENTEL